MPDKILGMYVHQHWPYNHPYAARTWSLEDWRGYASGLHQLGFNTVLIWPMLGMIPDPLPDSDRRYLQRLGDVVAMLHRDLDMRVFLAGEPEHADGRRGRGPLAVGGTSLFLQRRPGGSG